MNTPPTTRRDDTVTPFHIRLLAAATLLAAANAIAAEIVTVYRTDGTRFEAELGELNPTELVTLHPERGWTTTPLDDCLAVVAEPRFRPPFQWGRVRLTDGQQLPGRPVRAADWARATGKPAPDTRDPQLFWAHPTLGTLRIPIDRVRSIALDRDLDLPQTARGDAVQLRNGDVYVGFLLSLDDPVEMEVMDDDGSSILTMPWSRVAGMRLVTPDAPARGRRLWLRDGTILTVDTLRIEPDAIRIAGDDSAAATTLVAAGTVARDQLVAVVLQSDQLLPLADLTPISVSGPPTRYRIDPPQRLHPDATLDLGAVLLRGPVQIRYLLPPDAARLATEVVLPESARPWGDVRLVVRCDETVLLDEQLDAQRTRLAVNAPLDGRELVLELGAGEHGGVQCALEFRHARILLQPDTSR